MANAFLSYHKKRTFRMVALACLIILPAGVTGCSARYGRLQSDDAVFQSFQNYQPQPGYKYYLYGHSNRYYALAGLDSKYAMESRMWSAIDPDSDKFKTAVYWMWNDNALSNSDVYGANILDPDGNKAGEYYSGIRFVTVKFGEGDRIELMPDTPFLRGPSAENEDEKYLFGQESEPLYYSQME